MMNGYATSCEFVEAEVLRYGTDYIANLIDRGYLPRLTEHGWKWMVRQDSSVRENRELSYQR